MSPDAVNALTLRVLISSVEHLEGHLVCYNAAVRSSRVGSWPSDHYFRSVCLFVCLSVCLFVQSFSQPSLIRFRLN